MDDVVRGIQKYFKYDRPPNAINFNRYNMTQALDWHADNEALFPKADGTCTILSLSLGATRTFQVKKNFYDEVYDIPLAHGDFLEMSGKTQLFYQHCIARATDIQKLDGSHNGWRYNLTFRGILNHADICKCKAAT